MDEGTRSAGEALADRERSPEEIREEIEQTRRALGDTAAALAEKTDVKARAREKVEDVKQTAAATARGPVGIAVAAAVVVAAGGWIVARRRR